MAPTCIDLTNLRFLLYDVFDLGSLPQHARFEEHGRDTFEIVLETAKQMADTLLWPNFRTMDREPPVWVDGRVRVHPQVRSIMRAFGEAGWIGAHADYEHGGQQLPATLLAAVRAIFSASNYSAAVFPALTSGAAHLITSFGSNELVARYLPRMLSGEWQGTMALTEPQAGSSLADVSTLATPAADGSYRIRGHKIFTSAGEHDGVDNVVHLLLARIEGAPPGMKGLSLFVVPNRRPEGDALVDNDVTVISLFHKLGYRGAPIMELAFGEGGDCRGWLVGEPHRGLRYMFQMMNEARIDVGMAAAAIASAAYHAALDYARERPQGRRVTEKDPSRPQIPIIEHSDVKRMLLFQRAVVEGSLAVCLKCARLVDSVEVLPEGDERERCALLLGLLTPVAKSYPAEMAIAAVSQGLQCLGGYGYCDEYVLEQYYRDVRIHTIHEGTTGIQALDLLGRKVVGQSGRAFFTYLAEVERTITRAREVDGLERMAEAQAQALARLKEVTQHVTSFALAGMIERFLADATPYLELFSLVTVGWQWLEQALAATAAPREGGSSASSDFRRAKLLTCRFFFAYELPKTLGLARRLLDDDPVTLEDALF